MNNTLTPNNLNTLSYNRGVVSISTLFYCLLVAFSFSSHLIMVSFSGAVYCIILFFFTIGCILFSRISFKNDRVLIFLLVMSVGVILIGYLRDHRSDAFVDFIVFLCGLLLLFVHDNDSLRFYRAIRVIQVLGCFFAIGVYLQVLLPGVHRVVVYIFPSDFANAILTGSDDILKGVRGFTSNTGHAAGFICSGLFAVIANSLAFKRINYRSIILLGFLVIALAFTGKRGPVFFAFLSIMLFYLIPHRGSERFKRYWKIFLIVMGVTILYFAFRDAFRGVPFVNEILITIEKISNQEDASSSRFALYTWALKIFRSHPLTGIGWGMYRTTTVGNVTFRKALDAHNIYLQLLAETGIIGFLIFIAFILYLWNRTKSAYVDCINSETPLMWRVSIGFSFLFQTFFLLYGLSGNTLFDQHYQILYMLSCAVFSSYQLCDRYLRT